VLHCGDKQYLTFNEAVRGYKMRVQEQSDTTLSDDDFELPPEIRADYTDFRVLPDGRLIGVKRLLFHWTIHVDINLIGYEDRYCFCTYELAKAAFDEWDGQGDPKNWHRHPKTGRRRDLQTGREWIEF
jgi:hypothetical protein